MPLDNAAVMPKRGRAQIAWKSKKSKGLTGITGRCGTEPAEAWLPNIRQIASS